MSRREVTMSYRRLEKAQQILMLLLRERMRARFSAPLRRMALVLDRELESYNHEKVLLQRKYLKMENGKPVPSRDSEGRIIPDAFLMEDPLGYTSELEDLMDEKISFEIEPLRLLQIERLPTEPQGDWMFHLGSLLDDDEVEEEAECRIRYLIDKSKLWDKNGAFQFPDGTVYHKEGGLTGAEVREDS